MSRIDWEDIRWGTLTKWLLKHRHMIRRRYGMDPFRRDGKISLTVVKRLYRDEEFLKRLSRSHWKRIKKKLQFYINQIRG